MRAVLCPSQYAKYMSLSTVHMKNSNPMSITACTSYDLLHPMPPENVVVAVVVAQAIALQMVCQSVSVTVASL